MYRIVEHMAMERRSIFEYPGVGMLLYASDVEKCRMSSAIQFGGLLLIDRSESAP